MRIFSRIAVVLSALAVVLFSAGCDPETPGGGGGVTLPPIVTLNSGTDLISFNQERSLSNPSFVVSVSGEDGDASLRDLAITENGSVIPASQLNFISGQTANNPILTTGTDAGGFTYQIEITPSNTTAAAVTFGFRLTDVDGEVANTEVTITYTVTQPLIELLVEDGLVSGDATVTNSGTNFNVKVRMDDTDALLASLTILENGDVMDASRLTFNGGAFPPANPLVLIPEERMGVTFSINVNPDVTTTETRSYTFRATDANGVTGERTVSITFDPPASDLSFDTTGVFFNSSGVNLGGLDLDNGMAVAFNSAEAEIRDNGINLDLPVDRNWLATIRAINGAVLVAVDLSTIGDGTTFADVLTTATISTAFENGVMPPAGAVQVGDVFAVRRNDRTYLVRIDEVNFTTNDNNDNYKVSIKY